MDGDDDDDDKDGTGIAKEDERFFYLLKDLFAYNKQEDDGGWI